MRNWRKMEEMVSMLLARAPHAARDIDDAVVMDHNHAKSVERLGKYRPVHIPRNAELVPE